MTHLRRLFAPAMVAAALMVPGLSFSDVKISLKNGSEMIADECREEGNSYVCFKMGGTFVLEKIDVKSIKAVAARTGNVQPDAAAGADEDKGRPAASKSGEDVKKEAGDSAAADAEAKGTGPVAGKRLDEITGRKQELSAEREKLIKDRQQMQEDLKKAPDWMPDKQYDELKKRNAELDERLNRFNEEVRRLNKEEKDILDGLKK